MDRETLCTVLLESRAWMRLGLSVRDAQMRERAADCLAAAIVARPERDERPNCDQLALPL